MIVIVDDAKLDPWSSPVLPAFLEAPTTLPAFDKIRNAALLVLRLPRLQQACNLLRQTSRGVHYPSLRRMWQAKGNVLID